MTPSRKKKHSPSTLALASHGLASSQVVTQQPQFPTNSQSQSQSQSHSHLQSPQEKQQSQPVCPWFAHAPSFGQSQSPFLRDAHALSPSATASGELFLFGGYEHRSRSPSNDLYVISTRDFSTTLLQTSGDVPTPRYGHHAVLTSTSTLLSWGGKTKHGDQIRQNQAHSGSLFLLNLGTSDLLLSRPTPADQNFFHTSIPVLREWTRIVVNGPGPGRRYYHSMTMVGSKLFVFGGRTSQRFLNDIWAFDLNYSTFVPRFPEPF
jgi:Galactose oxidase, central domain